MSVLKNTNVKLTTLIIPTLLLLWHPLIGNSQNSTGFVNSEITVDAIIDSLIRQFSKIEDYTVKVKISVKMPRFRMPRKTIKLYFKSSGSSEEPDKIKVKSNGFAVVPKTGMNMSPNEYFKNLIDASVAGKESLYNSPHWVVIGKVNPDAPGFQINKLNISDSNELKTKMWVDMENWVITKIETYLGEDTVMSIRSEYKEFEEDIHLPTLTEIDFHLRGDFLASLGNHKPLGGPFGEQYNSTTKSDSGEPTGSIKMEFIKYRVNRGLKDRIFNESDF